MSECPHYSGALTPLRRPLPKERFKTSPENVCVCVCGVCLGWKRRAGTYTSMRLSFNPVLNAQQCMRVAAFLGVRGASAGIAISARAASPRNSPL